MPLLRVDSISKSFEGTSALSNVSLELEPGEVAGLIGENGAGKSTLIKILSGVHASDSGQIEWRGAPARFRNPSEALAAGIATIHQELAYFEKLTVAENLLMGEEWPRFPWGGTDWGRLNELARTRLAQSGLEIDPRALFYTLSPAQRQEISIARALSRDARLLILDEPTASLTEPEVRRLLGRLVELRERGIAILYVSHRLDEIMVLASKIIVLRDGALVAQYPVAEASIPRLVRDMVGRELSSMPVRSSVEPGPNVFSVNNISRRGLFENVSFSVRAGEVLGLAGLVGAGRSELARAIFGLYPVESGSMQLGGDPFAPRSAAEARSAGVIYLPEERRRQGFVPFHSTGESISLGFLGALSRFGWIRPGSERARVGAAISKFNIKTRDAGQPIGTLSGGNQQKALLARCIEFGPRVILLDEPTRGVDVGAKSEIHKLIDQLACAGKAVILISSDLPEVLSLSDRILVLRGGRIVAEFSSAEATQERVLMSALGS